MAKRGRTNAGVDHKTKGGCIWSMISLLDFRGGLSVQRKQGGQRLAPGSSFREHPPSSHLAEKDGALDNEDEDGHQTSKSVRMLINEEISKVEKLVQMSCTENKQKNSEYLHNKSSNIVLKEVPVYESCQPQPKDLEETLANNLDSVAMLQNIEDNHKQQEIKAVSGKAVCGNSIHLSIPKTSDNVAVVSDLQNLEIQADGNQCILQQPLNDTLEFFLHDKILSLKGMSCESERQELMNALDLLNSDRNLFLNLLQGNSSNLAQQIQDLQNVYIGNIFTPESHTLLDDIKSLRDKSNSQKECDKAVNKKPFIMEEEARHSNINYCHSVSSSTVGKQPPPNSRTESSHAASTSNSLLQSNCSLREHRKNEHSFFLFSFREIKRMVRNLLRPRKRKRHLVPLEVQPKNWYSFFLNDECKWTQNNRMESHLATRFIYNMKQPRGDKQHVSLTMQLRLTSTEQQIELNKCGLQGHGEENPPSTTSNSDDRDNIHDANVIQGFMHVNSVSVDIEFNSNQSTDITEICEDESHQNSGQDSPKDDLNLQIPCAPEINKSGDSDILIEKMDIPSPVSILEQTFLNDIRCKESTTSEESDHEPQFGEPIDEFHERSKLSYLRSLLDASGLLHCNAWSSAHRRLLDDELFLEVEPPSCGTLADLSLYFDRINEALLELQADCSHVKPWVGFVKPKNRPMPQGEDLVRELWRKAGSRGVYGDLRTLGEIIGADLRAQGDWVETVEGVDELGVVVGDEMLEAMLDEMVELLILVGDEGR